MTAHEAGRGVFEQPDAVDIIRRITRFLDEEVYGAVTDERINYRVRVAANLLRLVEREITVDDIAVDPAGLATTPDIVDRYGGVAGLADLLASGEKSIVDREVFDDLRRYVELKTAVAAIRRRPKHATTKEDSA